jgi:hypothetical protein
LVLIFAGGGWIDTVALVEPVVVVIDSVFGVVGAADALAFAAEELPAFWGFPAAPLVVAPAAVDWASAGAAAASSSAAKGSLPVSAVSCPDPETCCWASEATALVAWMCDAILDTAIPPKSIRLGYLLATGGPLLSSNKRN